MQLRGRDLHRARPDRQFLFCLLLIPPVLGLASCGRPSNVASPTRYVTEYGLGPDKWASAWLLIRHADTSAQLAVAQPGMPLEQGTSFDLPASELKRTGNQSTFETVRARFHIDDPIVAAMAAIVYDIEVNYWTSRDHPAAAQIEEAFRSLQFRYGRDKVTPECYVGFFDRVYQVLRDEQLKRIPVTAERLQLSCGELTHLAARDRELIHEVPIVDLLSAAAAGRKVVYVDVRESDEFAESHLPGALNIQIRDVSPALRARLKDADYVVSYCVKDFRGYEMAKALAQVGVENSVIMRPYGIKGWISLGLPVTGDKAMGEAESRRKFEGCLANIANCLVDTGE